MTYRDVEMIEVTDVGVKDFTAKGVEVEVAMQIKNTTVEFVNLVIIEKLHLQKLELQIKQSILNKLFI